LFIVGLVKYFSRTAWLAQLKTNYAKLFQIFSGVAGRVSFLV